VYLQSFRIRFLSVPQMYPIGAALENCKPGGAMTYRLQETPDGLLLCYVAILTRAHAAGCPGVG
jgi:hypothetical protein